MISVAQSEELSDVLAWDWIIDPRLSMADRGNRPPRTATPKATDDRLAALEQDVASLKTGLAKCATKAEVKHLDGDISELKASIDRIANQVQALVDRKGFWKSFWAERHWTIGAVLASVAILLTLMGIVLSAAYFGLGAVMDNHLRPIESRIDGLQERIAKVEGRVLIGNASTVIRQLQELPPAEIKRHEDEILTAKKALAETNEKQLPNYWPTAFGVLRLASLAATPQFPQVDLQHASHIEDVNGVRMDGRGTTAILGGKIIRSRFDNYVIVFDPSVSLTDVLFVNCVFVFPEDVADPSRQIKAIGSELLNAANIANVKVTTG